MGPSLAPMRAFNLATQQTLAEKVTPAQRLGERLRGLLGRDELPRGEALWISPCKSIHTIGMRFPLDVLFLDKSQQVVGMARNLPPNRITPLYLRAVSVLELPAGTIDATTTQLGNRLDIS